MEFHTATATEFTKPVRFAQNDFGGNPVNQPLAASSPILVGKRRISEAKQCETGAEFRNLR